MYLLHPFSTSILTAHLPAPARIATAWRHHFKIDGQLRYCTNPTEEELIWILLYAKYICLICDTAEKLREAITVMNATFLCWGLTTSTKKTKVLVVCRDAAAQNSEPTIMMRGEQLEVVSQLVFGQQCHL